MFKIAFFVDDKNVGTALRSLAGVARGAPEVVPVINAEVDGGSVVAATNGELVNLFARWLAEKGISTVTAKITREFLASIGRPAGSASYMLQRARQYRLIGPRIGAATNASYAVNAAFVDQQPKAKKAKVGAKPKTKRGKGQ